ncbi:MAG TPA: methyltransferase domain-containing protein [Phycisphaerae bacterium]|nr:methyltransferase domain-containing protein [Phycisphaerae bacterium]
MWRSGNFVWTAIEEVDVEGLESPPVLDVRDPASFERLHRTGAVNIPLEELGRRMHELPARDTPLVIFDGQEARAMSAAERLHRAGRNIAKVAFGDAWLHEGPTRTGPSTSQLWSPHGIVCEAIEHAKPLWGHVAGRRALDIACGTGRDAIYLATQGLHVDAWDILPDALERCDDLALRNGVLVQTACRDVEAQGQIIAPDVFDIIVCVNFLHRPLMPQIAAGVQPGGLVAYETFVEPQRERFGKPAREAHVLKPGELSTWFVGWEILTHREGPAGPRRIVAGLIARKP